MYELTAQLIILFSAGGILIIIFRKFPALKNLPEKKYGELYSEKLETKEGITKKIKKINYQDTINSFVVKLEKFLRKFRIIVLKLDNRCERWIQTLKTKEQSFKAKTRLPKVKWPEKKYLEEKKKETDKEEFVDKEKEYIGMIVKNPRDTEAYKKLGSLYLEQKNYKDAEASFRQILKIDPKNSEAKEKLREIEKNKPT